MSLENLYQLIRKEDVVFWIGAGCSIGAGYPTAQHLSEIIYSEMTPSEKEMVNPYLLLPDVSEEFVRLKGGKRQPLMELLIKIYKDKKAKKVPFHRTLAQIPHVKTIITTNYDELIEKAYKNSYHKIFSSLDIPYITKDKVEIFKVHGDITKIEKIIITKGDYVNFDSNKDALYWSVITERIASKTILFLGYGFEDPNIEMLFNKIIDKLTNHSKQIFLIAPNLKAHKISDIERKGISYINLTAEKFIKGLLKNIEENIFEDLRKKQVSLETVNKFASTRNILPIVTAEKDDSLNVTAFKSKDGKPLSGNMKLTINSKDESDLDGFNDFLAGRKYSQFKVPKEMLERFTLTVEGLNFRDITGGTELLLQRRSRRIKFDIRFADFELTNLLADVFVTKFFFEVKVEFNRGHFSFYGERDDSGQNIKLKFERNNETPSSTKDEIELCTLLNKISSGNSFKLYPENWNKMDMQFSQFKDAYNETLEELKYLHNLQKIEKHFDVRFTDFALITNNTEKTVDYIIDIIDAKDFDMKEEAVFYADGLTQEEIGQLGMMDEIVIAPRQKKHEVFLHGVKIILGYPQYTFSNARVTNLKDLISGQRNVVKITTENMKAAISYLQELPKESGNNNEA